VTSKNTAILIRFQNLEMTFSTIISTVFGVRALLVLATLISLCVSNNVGPSFLPLPVMTDRIAENSQGNQPDKTSRRPSHTESDSFRVPMMGQTHKRTAKGPQPQPLGAAPRTDLVLPNDTRVAIKLSFPTLLLASRSVSQPRGRAPPRLV
jgi:hypothetical protein